MAAVTPEEIVNLPFHHHLRRNPFMTVVRKITTPVDTEPLGKLPDPDAFLFGAPE